MTKDEYIESLDIPGLNEHIEGCMERIKVLENEASRYRYDRKDFIANGAGKAEALSMEEARLIDQVNAEFAGQRSNADQRDARLAQLKHEDDVYQATLNAIATTRMALEQYDIEIKHYGYKLQAGMQALKLKTALLRFLSEG